MLFASCDKDDDSSPAGTPTPTDPVSISLNTIILEEFTNVSSNGSFWDSATNNPDPFIKVYKEGVLVFESVPISNAAPGPAYPLNTPSTGSMPVTINAGQSLRFELYDNDSETSYQYMTSINLTDAVSFIDNLDGAESFTDLIIYGPNDIALAISGDINY